MVDGWQQIAQQATTSVRGLSLFSKLAKTISQQTVDLLGASHRPNKQIVCLPGWHLAT